VASGAYSNGTVTWEITGTQGDYTLTVSGSGAIPADERPWSAYEADIRHLVLGEGITKIGDGAFYNCIGFTGELILPSTLKEIGNSAFYGCGGFTGNLVLPQGLTAIGNAAFMTCRGFTGDLIIPSGVTAISNSAFAYCSGFNGRLVIPEGVTSIGTAAFCDGKNFVGDLIIPSTVKKIGYSAFESCNKLDGRLVLPAGLTSIGEFAFYECKKLSGQLVLPSGLTTIEPYTFYGCSSFSGELVIPASIKTISSYAFYRCIDIASVRFEGAAPEKIDGAGDGFPSFDPYIVIYYNPEQSGFTTPEWKGYEAYPISPAVNENPFTDVHTWDYYYDSVLWAYKNGITAGTSEGIFEPEASCTRGQVVTFLWRAKGQPEPNTTVCPFTDVHTWDYFYKAVLWAYENGITAGVSATEFGPETTVDRGQVVTFMWRDAGMPGASVSNPFVDVANGIYYHDAVLWAYQNGVTSGINATEFGPANPCTRGQVVTFLYRAIGK